MHTRVHNIELVDDEPNAIIFIQVLGLFHRAQVLIWSLYVDDNPSQRQLLWRLQLCTHVVVL